MLGASGVALTVVTILVSICIAGVGIVGVMISRGSRRDARKLGEAANQMHESEYDLGIMTATIQTLRGNVEETRAELRQLRQELVAARASIRRLRTQVQVAEANVGILSQHVVQHVPAEIPFPRLREVPSNGGG